MNKSRPVDISTRLGGEIVRLWARNLAAVPPMSLVWVMALYFPTWMWSAVNGNLLNALGKIRWRSRVIIVNGLLNLALSLALVRYLGLSGVALGSLLAMATTEAVVVPLMVRRLLRQMRLTTTAPLPP